MVVITARPGSFRRKRIRSSFSDMVLVRYLIRFSLSSSVGSVRLEHTLSVERFAALVPTEKHLQDLAHHARERLLSGHFLGFLFAFVILAKQILAAHKWDRHQVQHVAKLTAAATTDRGPSAPIAALSLAQVQTRVTHQLTKRPKVTRRSDLGDQSRKQSQRDDAFLRARKLRIERLKSQIDRLHLLLEHITPLQKRRDFRIKSLHFFRSNLRKGLLEVGVCPTDAADCGVPDLLQGRCLGVFAARLDALAKRFFTSRNNRMRVAIERFDERRAGGPVQNVFV